MQEKRHIAIIAGGDSSEHEVSLRSAAGLKTFIDAERYDTTIVDAWYGLAGGGNGKWTMRHDPFISHR